MKKLILTAIFAIATIGFCQAQDMYVNIGSYLKSFTHPHLLPKEIPATGGNPDVGIITDNRYDRESVALTIEGAFGSGGAFSCEGVYFPGVGGPNGYQVYISCIVKPNTTGRVRTLYINNTAVFRQLAY